MAASSNMAKRLCWIFVYLKEYKAHKLRRGKKRVMASTSDWAKNQLHLSEISLYNGINALMKLQARGLRYETK